MMGGRMVWVEMSRGRFVGGHNVKAPKYLDVLRKNFMEAPQASTSSSSIAIGKLPYFTKFWTLFKV
jgi:hypothetical protein